MDNEEAKEYLEKKKFIFTILHSFIDYNDIENPVKTIPGKLIELALAPAEAKKLQVTLQSHEFTDHKSLLQMISSEDVTEFLN